jgi:acetamidase/formamidase
MNAYNPRMTPSPRLLALACSLCLAFATSAHAQQTHTLVPDHFFNTWSAAHPPVLHVKPGDRVVTKTVDAAGADWTGRQVAQGPNPQTGPFYVDGAEPGDTLVVRLDKLDINRPSGFSSSLLAPYTVDPQAIGARTDRAARRLTWTIDKAKGVARLDQADVQPGGIELPLRLMLGCVGVAPARKEAITTSTPGPWGGNMDYTWMGVGVTLMLPVNESGALLFLGDGHARMGEGEVVGTGIETSMDVEFSVDVIKRKAIGWPRMETATHVGVLASGRPLIEAFQHATTELQKWLVADYGFTERGAQTFMGQAAEYDIANVVDPNFTVVAKIPKGLLPATVRR